MLHSAGIGVGSHHDADVVQSECRGGRSSGNVNGMKFPIVQNVSMAYASSVIVVAHNYIRGADAERIGRGRIGHVNRRENPAFPHEAMEDLICVSPDSDYAVGTIKAIGNSAHAADRKSTRLNSSHGYISY